MGWSLLPNALRPFQIYCAAPNLGITRTWIYRLNFLRGLIFQAWGCLTSLKSQTRNPQLKVPPGGLVLRIVTSWKNTSTSAGFEPANLGSRSEHVTPRPPRPTDRLVNVICVICPFCRWSCDWFDLMTTSVTSVLAFLFFLQSLLIVKQQVLIA